VDSTPSRPLLARPRPLVGMVHVAPSPASPGHPGVADAVDLARRDALRLVEAGFDALLLENFHDFPPIRGDAMGPDVPAYLTALATAVRREVGDAVPVGIQVLFAAHRVAVAVAHAAGLEFVRVEAWTHAHVSDKGIAEASAGDTVRYARSLGAAGIRYWADVKKKHASHALTADLGLEDIVALLPDHGAHAAIVTGLATGHGPDPEDLRRARAAGPLPVVVGSGLSVQNAAELVPLADGFIVGSSVKVDGDWRQPVDPDRAAALADRVGELRGS